MKIYKPKIKDLYLFILGFLGFSLLGQYVVLSVLHFPFSFMELYYLPLTNILLTRLRWMSYLSSSLSTSII